MMLSSRKTPTSTRGFTLVEVLVAVAVLALALGAIISGMARFTSNAAYLRQKTIAIWVAHNRLTELAMQPTWPDVGKTNGESEMSGVKWRWKAEVKKTEDDNLRRVDLDVMAPDDHRGNHNNDGVLASVSSFITK
jgi:general secretion pathway protein I